MARTKDCGLFCDIRAAGGPNTLAKSDNNGILDSSPTRFGKYRAQARQPANETGWLELARGGISLADQFDDE